MEILLLLIPVSVLLVLLIGAAFWWSVRTGQFDDLDGPAYRILADDDTTPATPNGPDHAGPARALTPINPARVEAQLESPASGGGEAGGRVAAGRAPSCATPAQL